MTNTIIYTFTSQYTETLYPSLELNKKLFLYINYYRESILSALSLGYDVEIYLSPDCVEYFSDLNIKIHTVGKFDSYLFDFIKAYVLSTRRDPFVLADGDIVFKKRLVFEDCELMYEDKCYTGASKKILDNKKDKTWHIYYKPYVEYLSNKKIGENITEWTGQRLDYVHNIGLLYCKNYFLTRIIVDRWFQFNNFINNCDYSNKIKFTAIGAQYLLTEILNYHNLTNKTFSKDSFTHNIGTTKFSKPIVPDSYVQFNSNKTLL